jgi:uncharacterized protein YpmB
MKGGSVSPIITVILGVIALVIGIAVTLKFSKKWKAQRGQKTAEETAIKNVKNDSNKEV